jgi:hypothetical protein
MPQDAILGYLYLRMNYSRLGAASPGPCPGTFSVVPAGLVSVGMYTQDCVLGYSQPELSKLADWATL